MTKSTLDTLIDNLLTEAKVPKSGEDWDLVQDAIQPHVESLMEEVSAMLDNSTDSLEDELSHHWNFLVSPAQIRRFFLKELIRKLQQVSE